MRSIAAALALALVTGACSSGKRASPDGTASPSPDASALATPPPAIGTVIDAARVPDTQTLRARGGGIRLPRTGVYRYTTQTFVRGAEEETGTLAVRVQPARAVSGGMAQRQVWDTGRARREFAFLWHPDRVLLSRQVTTSSDGKEFRCDFVPPPPVFVFPLRIDAEWSETTACGSGHSTYDGDVLRAEALDVEGKAIPTLVVRKTVEAVQQPDLATVQFQWFSPRHLIPLYIVTRDLSGGYQAETRSRLVSLTPEP